MNELGFPHKFLQVDDKTIVMVVDSGDDDRKSGGGEAAHRHLLRYVLQCRGRGRLL